MITEAEDGELHCSYDYCQFCDSGICYGGLYQCLHIVERARACLPFAIEDYEYLKAHPYSKDSNDPEYLYDLADLKRRVDTYREIIDREG